MNFLYTDTNIKISRNSLIQVVSESFIDIRKEKNLTQVEMANILSISKNTIVRIERKHSRLSWSTVIAILLLFSDTKVIKRILNDRQPIELITKFSFLENGI